MIILTIANLPLISVWIVQLSCRGRRVLLLVIIICFLGAAGGEELPQDLEEWLDECGIDTQTMQRVCTCVTVHS